MPKFGKRKKNGAQIKAYVQQRGEEKSTLLIRRCVKQIYECLLFDKFIRIKNVKNQDIYKETKDIHILQQIKY